MSKELKPCPFCGGKVSITNQITSRLYTKEPTFCVYCWTCDLLFGFDIDYGGQFATPEEAIEVWNTRYQEAKP